MTRLSVMTYNIRLGGRGGEALTQVVRAAAPDVLLVNESPKTPLVWERRCRLLAEAWGMEYAVGGRSAGANMVVVRPGIVAESKRTWVIPQPLFRPRRGIALARVRAGGVGLWVVSCHLGLDPGRRVAEVEQVVAVAVDLEGPAVVAGDLNEPPGGPCWARVRTAGYLDAGSDAWRTFPAARPARRIDALLVRGAPVVHHGAPGVDEALLARASDHRPVFAELEV